MKKLVLIVVWASFAASAYGQVDVLVQRYDNSRTGQNLNESTLTVSNVNATNFGKLYSFAVDGYVYAQPLYKSNVTIPGQGTHNVVFIATQHDSVYAFDADSATPLWKVSFINPAAGVTTSQTTDTGNTDIIPEVGITSTPVIDPNSNTLYVVAKTKESGSPLFRIHALDITTGADRVAPVVIQASASTFTLNPINQLQRPGLVLVNGVVYVAFGSNGDFNTWHGWLLGYNAANLTQTVVFCVTPNLLLGGGIWAVGEAPPVDPSGNIYINTGNGDLDGISNFGDAFVKLSTAANLTVMDFFSPFNQQALNTADLDIASAGFILLPDSAGTAAHPHLIVGGGKDGTIYVLDRDHLGGFNGSYTNPDSQIVQEIWNAIGSITTNPKAPTLSYVQNNYTIPGYWQNHLYWCGVDDVCKMFNLTNGLLATPPASRSSASFGYPGAQPVISASSPVSTSAIMWAVQNGNRSVLHAYDATNLATELYNSTQAANNRDQGGQAVKFAEPTVANGKVFVGAQSQVDVYGLLASAPPQAAAPTFTPPAGNYSTPQPVTMSDATPGVTIFYTLDGSVPTVSSVQYTGPVTLSGPTTVNAIAVANGFLTSPIATAVYRIGGTLVSTGGFVQGNYAVPHGIVPSVSIPFTGAQASGDLNVVAVGWNDATATVTSVADTMGNVYTLAVGPTRQGTFGGQSIYYAKNIVAAAANVNSVRVNFGGAGAGDPDIRIAEYAGLDPNNPLDATAAATGNNTNSDSGPATITSPTELLVGANLVQTGTVTPGAGFNTRMITDPDSDILEDAVVTAMGSYRATATLNPSGQWVMQMVTFRAINPDTTPPVAPSNLTAVPSAPNQINLSWTASTDNLSVSSYTIERCSGVGCTDFAQLTTVGGTTTAYNDIRTYPFLRPESYRVLASDAAGNPSLYSNIATATAPPDTTPPTTPTNLAATPVSTTQINLSWTASIDDVGVTGYIIERCQGAGCVSFGRIAAPLGTGTTYSDTGLSTSTTYSYRVWATDATGNASGFSNVSSSTTPSTGPTFTAPSSLTATAASNTQINLSWTAATEIGGTISNYLIERCSGANCGNTPSNFAQVATSTTTAFNNTGLLASTSYSYRVRATDGSNFSAYSNTGSATTLSTPPPPPTISFIQVNSATPQSPQTPVVVTYTAAQRVGDLNVVVVGWNDSTATVSSVKDTLGNVYTLAVGPTVQSGTATQSIYYAKNIAAAPAGANSVTVAFSVAAIFPDIRIAEYSGIDTSNPLDVARGAQGNSSSSDSGPVTTNNANDLLVGANMVQTGTVGAGPGYTSRIITNPDSDILEDRVVTALGSYSATAPASPSAQWIMQLVAFKAAGSAPTPTAPSSLTATPAGPVQINLSWTAATETGGTIANYLIERCAGAACSTFAQVGTSTTTGYNDTSNLLGSTSYSYRVRAMDAANVTGPYSNTASATTAAPTFTAPSSLTATPAGPVQINLSWTAATETGGTITNYLIERCSGACSSFAQVGTSATTTFNDTSNLLGSTAYSYRVRVTDGTNFSGYSNTNSATTAAPTFTAPSSLTATAASNAQINLSWTAATETGGTLSQYLIERCAGANCGSTPSNFAQVGTSATTAFNDTGLTASTSYSYRIRATDAASNFSAYSNTATAATPASTPTAPASLTATPAGPVQINLSWTASTETGGTISNYLIERCSGINCGNTPSNFAQVGSSTTTGYNDTSNLLGSTSYSYRVRAMDAANNTGPYSNTASATTAAPTFVAPSSLTATAAGPVQINLSWTAATETGGTLTQYLVERCTGATCSNFVQVGTSTTTTFNNTGLLGSTTYSYRVRATDGTNFSAYSNTNSATTAAPTFTAPSSLTATAASNTQINLSWTAATETGGTLSQYLVESCQGASCTTFAQVGTSTTTTFNNTGLLASTSYSYRVRATDAASNFSLYSNTASATTLSTPPPPPTISFIQVNAANPQTPQTTVTVAYTLAQRVGDLNVVVVGWNDSTATVSSVKDTLGNVYALAVGPTVQSGTASQSMYYAKNIAAAAANANTVTVKFNGSAIFADIRILEYSGLDTTNPLDVAAGASGNSATSSSAVTTTNANDLIIGANVVQTGTPGAGAGFTSRIITSPDSDIVEDRVVTALGSYSATAPVSGPAPWIMQIVAFKAHP
jgi:hypothetical protein